MENNSTSNIGFGGALQITFIVLKLCGVVEWSWWIVLTPILVPVAVVLLICIGMFIHQFWNTVKTQRRPHGKS